MLNHLTITRSLAVIMVLLFHFDKTLLASGYIGVDVFFVISGFLITKISSYRVEDYSSLKQFYIKRIMRIFPAFLFISTVVVFALSLIEYLEIESLQMFRDTMLANSNFRAEKINLDYFSDNNNNYLLHLWTISIELQFYLLFPLLMLSSVIKRNLLKVIVALVLVSFVIVFFERSYYDSLGRMFAFTAGSLSFFIVSKVKSNNYIFVLSLIGLMILSFMNLDVKSYPNFYNIPVVVFSAMALIFGKVENEKRYKIPIFIGLISYSLYLWHYPLFLFFEHSAAAVNFINVFILLSLLLSLSVFTYYVIEKRFIIKNYGKYTWLIILVPHILVMAVVYYKKHQTMDFALVNNFYEKMTFNPLLYHSDLENRKVSEKYKGCLENKGQLLTKCSTTKVNKDTKTALVMGNSFVHTGGLIFTDIVTAHYNIKSDFYYLFGDKKQTKALYKSIKAGKYDYLILFYPWLSTKKSDLIKEYKELSQYTQIIFVKGTKYNNKINKKQLFRFKNLFHDSTQPKYECVTQRPFTTDSGYAAIDASLEELHAKALNLYEVQKNANGDYICSYDDIALYKDHFHMNNYAGEFFARRYINRELGKDIFK